MKGKRKKFQRARKLPTIKKKETVVVVAVAEVVVVIVIIPQVVKKGNLMNL